MNLLTELSNVFTKADGTITQIGIADENEKTNDECCNIISRKLKLIYIVEKEKHPSISSSVRSKVK